MSVENSTFLNQLVLITGGTRGMGKAIAEKLLEYGAKVIITGTHRRKGWWDNNTNCSFIPVNFLNIDETSKFLDQIKQQGILYLVNCAGIISNNKLESMATEELENTHWINFTVPISIIKNLIPQMKKNQFGRIVNIASIAAIQHRIGSSAYATSKSALHTATRALALEYAENQIIINAVSPGYTDTDMIHSLSKNEKERLVQQVPLKRLCSSHEIANAVLFLLSSENKFITGHNLIIDGGVTLKQ